MQRRELIKAGVLGAMAAAVRPLDCIASQRNEGDASFFSTSNVNWQQAYDKALSILARNVQLLPRYPRPVLIEGSEYAGIWQECGPYESLVYRHFRPDVARDSHMIFFALQRSDGQLPANNKRTGTGFGQVQMVVPIAATAWELAQASGDSELLETAYRSCSRWDAWLMQYRNTRRSGLIEGFCTYDTGMDSSPRWAGMPSQCPQADARLCPPVPTLPRLCPDLSATVFGARVALSAMAEALGKSAEAAEWKDRAELLRKAIMQRLYVEEDASFYDLDAENHFVRVRSVVLSRVCSEHVVDAATFARMWQRQLGDPAAFWTPYPLPSIAANDPAFVRPSPRNCWCGPSQALTALRAGRWLDHYGRSAEFAEMMQQWCAAMIRDPSFRQQIDPINGRFTPGDEPNYSPASLLMYDYTWRLAGMLEVGDELHWNVRPGSPGAQLAKFRLRLRSGKQAEMRYAGSEAEISLNGHIIGAVRGVVRLVTDRTGRVLQAQSIDRAVRQVDLKLMGAPLRRLTLQANERVSIEVL